MYSQRRAFLCGLVSVEKSVKLPFFGLYTQLDKNTAEAVCGGFLDLNAGRRMQYKCLLMLFACFLQGLRGGYV